MPRASAAKSTVKKSENDKRRTKKTAGTSAGGRSTGSTAKKKRLSTSKALVPAGQVELTSRERLAKKREANASVKKPKTRSRRTTVKNRPRGRKRGAAVASHAPVPLIERQWFRPAVRAMHEGMLLTTSALLIYILLSLTTYHVTDPGFSHVGVQDEVKNLGGQAGAWMASLLFSLLGYAAYWVPLLLVYTLYLLFMVGRKPFSAALAGLRLLGLVAVLLSGTTVLTLHLPAAILPMSAGGILGLEIVGELAPMFNELGMTLLAMVLLLTGISMFTDFSWANFAGWIGRQALRLAGRSRDGFVGIWDYMREERYFDADEWDEPDMPSKKRGGGRPGGANGADQGDATFDSDFDIKRGNIKQGVQNNDKDLADQATDGVPMTLLQGLDKLKATKERFVATLRQRRTQKQQDQSSPAQRSEPSWGDGSLVSGALVEEGITPPPISTPRSTAQSTVEVDQLESSAEGVTGKGLGDNSGNSSGKSLSIEKRADQEPKKNNASRVKKRRKSLFDSEKMGDLPPIELLDPAEDGGKRGFSEEELKNMSRLLELKLRDFNIEAEVEAVIPGPVVTRFEIQPAPGIKVMRITNLAKDLARSLAVISVRVVEVIPGKTTVGIEIPNSHRETIRLSEVISSDAYERSKSPLTLCLGKDISGNSVTADLAKMPHLLAAGTTGSGKSVGLNAMLISMLFKSTPDQLRMIMIDPKMLELSVYDDIPHLLSPVVTDMKEAANALRWCVAEMERRYRLMAAMGVRNLAGFNRKVNDAIKAGNPLSDPLWRPVEVNEKAPELTSLPNIVVVIDEFADMMMIVGKKVEELIARIAQKARAAGIHLILATQRPSVDVITGLIKANVPSRIAFQVSSKVDSRTILDQGGAEQLLGMGDMLYLPPGTALPLRVHGAFVSDEEVHRVCDDWRERGDPDYLDEILDGAHEAGAAPGFEAEKSADDPEADPLYDEAVKFVTQTRKASISSVQRKLKIGYNRAARMIDSMETAGVVSPMQNNGSREVIAPPPV